MNPFKLLHVFEHYPQHFLIMFINLSLMTKKVGGRFSRLRYIITYCNLLSKMPTYNQQNHQNNLLLNLQQCNFIKEFQLHTSTSTEIGTHDDIITAFTATWKWRPLHSNVLGCAWSKAREREYTRIFVKRLC